MDCFHLTVGEKFDRDMPAESMSIVLNGGVPMLTFTYSVTVKDIAAFQEGSSSFALFSNSSILFFLFKIKGFLE
ncbi:MAG: hypothetical protein PHG36_07390 [Dehalococcoidia bacterium]|nr:hypothetical protein [Dehalococcoidia bacterium]